MCQRTTTVWQCDYVCLSKISWQRSSSSSAWWYVMKAERVGWDRESWGRGRPAQIWRIGHRGQSASAAADGLLTHPIIKEFKGVDWRIWKTWSNQLRLLSSAGCPMIMQFPQRDRFSAPPSGFDKSNPSLTRLLRRQSRQWDLEWGQQIYKLWHLTSPSVCPPHQTLCVRNKWALYLSFLPST